MGFVVPTLRVADLDRSLRFYDEGLGFKKDWEWRDAPELPPFAQIRREGMMLYLSEGEGDSQPGALVYLYVEDVDRWYGEIGERGIATEGAPFDQAWGNREFRVIDLDKNILCFCTPQPRGGQGGQGAGSPR